MRRLLFVAALLLPSSVLAQGPPAGQQATFGELHFVGETEVQLRVEWTGGQVAVRVRTDQGSVELHRGGAVSAYGAPNDRGLMVAVVDNAVHTHFVPIENGRPGAPVSAPFVHREDRGRAAVGAAIARRPDGFAVFFQEANTVDPMDAYQTFLARFDPGGRTTGPAVEVQTPWPLADALYLPAEDRYYFLLFYGQPNTGTRLCGVHVRADVLTNVEHPFWVSPAGAMDEARLFLRGGQLVALYRDGPRLMEASVATGQWGREPPAPRTHGPLDGRAAFGAQQRTNALTVIRRDLSPVTR